jgi:broad specificity phosphatase PhoE
MTRLVLCRHTEEGNGAQADLLADALAPLDVSALYTSPLPRAVRTAAAVAVTHRLVAVEIEALREIERGDVEGLEFDSYPRELRTALLERPGHARFPGGESFGELQSRACGALEDIVAAHRAETVVVITHAGPIRAALARWLELPPDASFRIDQRYSAVNVVEFTDGIPFVRLVNGERPSG